MLLYLIALLLFVPSLFSKGVAVVLPLLMLLVDYYEQRRDFIRIVIEKVPFFGLSFVFGLMAVYTQSQTAALDNVQDVPFHLSAITSSYSLTLYLIQVLVPFQLGGFHPYPPPTGTLPWYMIISVVTPLILLCTAAVFRKNKNVIFGLGFMLICFLPVIQFLPVGDAIVADRYAYMPYLGAFFLIAYLLVQLFNDLKKHTARQALILTISVYMIWLGTTAHAATNIWKNSLNLWTNVIDQHPQDSKGYINRGRFYFDKGNLGLARADYDRAMEISPELPVVYQHFGLYYQKKQQQDSALLAFSEAIRLDSTYYPAWLNMALSHMHLQQFDTAFYYLNELEALDTANVLVHINKGVIYEQLEDFDSAIGEYGKAIEKNPNDYKGHQYRAVVMFRVGRYEEAYRGVESWISRSPRDGKAYLWKSRIEFMLGDFQSAESNAGMATALGTEVSEEYLTMIADSLNSQRGS